ncbi:hypothetical protein [Neobacillus sp. D3-1R]|uniref:hypothetical protein n=1 Tax=Neobacillus sp. D3-1R TaxID=3445778 RepID=UPI003F9F96E2
MHIEGNIIAGEFDPERNEFSLQRVKHFYTESTIKETQLESLYQYLKKHENEQDGQIITLYDQMPLRLTQSEVKQLIMDLQRIYPFYH